MFFKFEPRKTRLAVSRIAALFGADEQMVLGLDALFDRLARMDVDQLARFAEQASADQIDTLCDFYSKAPTTQVLLAITLVLSLRKDRRWTYAGSYCFFHNPNPRQLDEWHRLWPILRLNLPRPSEADWLIRYLESTLTKPLEFLVDALKNNRFPFESLDERYFRTPLFDQLTDYLFAEGGPLLQRLHAEPAAQKAARYLAMGDDRRVLGYLRHYPASRWQPAFLERLYSARGKPDPKTAPFYKELDEAVLWGIRVALFRARMMASASPKQQQAFWMERLHRCQDWVYLDGVTQIMVRPLAITEKLDYSIVYMLHGDREIARINHGSSYVSAMHDVVTDYLGW